MKYLMRHNGEREKLYTYLDPIPIEMRPVVIMELCAVPIDWKMLTTLRPKVKLEIEYYSKYDLPKYQYFGKVKNSLLNDHSIFQTN